MADSEIITDEAIVGNQGISHSRLLLQYEQADEMHNGWRSFLERAQQRTTSMNSAGSTGEGTRPMVGEATVWMVRVLVSTSFCITFLYLLTPLLAGT